jgi:phosphatidylserine/phosphatidylglycerophosphate/cardiolipin synthase-like enzyme
MVCRLLLIAALLCLFGLAASVRPVHADQVEVHYAPVENLERVDVGLLRSARAKIDMAAYSLTDWAVVDALIDADRRGVTVRIVLDPTQRHAFDRLRAIKGNVRIKAAGDLLHLKSYSIDGASLRSGSANFSASGLKRQDNDIVVVRERGAVMSFDARFEQIWSAAAPLVDAGSLAPAVAPAPRLPKSDSEADARSCPIKGNVNRKGDRIYHAPGGRDYNRVTMKGTGTRWFCSEEEAIAAGWRRAGSR